MRLFHSCPCLVNEIKLHAEPENYANQQNQMIVMSQVLRWLCPTGFTHSHSEIHYNVCTLSSSIYAFFFFKSNVTIVLTRDVGADSAPNERRSSKTDLHKCPPLPVDVKLRPVM